MGRGQLRIAVHLLAAAVSSAVISATYAREAVLRDVEGYAIASCLAAQEPPYLKDQGEGWASAIIQRSKGSLDAFRGVLSAVKAELAKRNMAVIRSEDEQTKDKPLPVMYCGEVIDAPSIHAAISKAVRRLAPAYPRR